MKAIFKKLTGIPVMCAMLAMSGNSFPNSSKWLCPIIPKPSKVELGDGSFTLSKKTQIVVLNGKAGLQRIGKECSRQLHQLTGLVLPFKKAVNLGKIKNAIVLELNAADTSLGKEGYRLSVEPSRITIKARTEAGVFYGMQSLLQVTISDEVTRAQEIKIPAFRIEDQPRFEWRGMHLDVSRHFFPKQFIKTYIDMLAMHKMNVFHWHLTDDQGWRIEIKRYPKLAKIAAWRVDREDQYWSSRAPQREGEKATYGGYYTQKEIKEIVRYAKSRFITVVPEIEMPAHTTAALAAYPMYSCTGGPFTVPPGGVWPITDIYCAGNDETFKFLENILTEVIRLFPGTYIHIGGDEADKTEWKKCPKCQKRIKDENLKDEGELQSYFVKRIEKFLLSKNRRLVGWDEILEGGLAPEATVMSWRGMEGGIAAAQQGHDVVMTPTSFSYFDYYQGTSEFEPLAIGGYLPLSKVYSFDPVPEGLNPEQASHVLGAQANVWTEFIPTPNHAQFMTLPRMAAMAEVGWSPKESRDWDDFRVRVEHIMKSYEAMKLNYAKSAYVVAFDTFADSLTRRLTVSLSSEMKTPDIRYTLDGSEPSASSTGYEKPFTVDKTAVVKACAFSDGKPLARTSEQTVFIHKATFKPVRVKYPFERYLGGGEYGLTNGIRGSKAYNDAKWQGYHQNDLEAIVDLGETMPVTRLTTSYLQNTPSWIFLPTSVEYGVSDDGTNFNTVASFENPVPQTHQEISVREFSKELKDVKARYIQVRAKNVGVCPEWHGGKGEKAWLFVDEIVVE